MFVYDGSRVTFRASIGCLGVVAIQKASQWRVDSRRALRIVDGASGPGCAGSGNYRELKVVRLLRLTVIAGLLLILLLSAYSIGVSVSAKRVQSAPSSGVGRGSGISTLTVMPGDSAWSIAAKMATSPSQVPSIAKEIIAIQGGTMLRPGTVLYVAH